MKKHVEFVAKEQRLLFIREWVTNRGHLPNMAKPIPYDGPKPHRVWTLYAFDETVTPALPITPIHNHNAFLEDCVHDWNIYGGHFRYRSRVADRPVWILLEF
jgi:hypothetical protein